MESRNPDGRGAVWRGYSDDVLGPMSIAPDLTNAPFMILPIGATEQHGAVLPVGMDWIVATELAARVGDTLGAYVLPALPFGTSMEHRGGSGTVWLRPATLAAVVRDVIESAAAWGMRKTAIITGHGGNFILGPTVRELNTDHPDFRIVLVPERIMASNRADPDELHAGAVETSLACHLCGIEPPSADHDEVPDAARDELNHRPLLSMSRSGVWGHPSRASRELGERELAERAQRIVEYLRQSMIFVSDIPVDPIPPPAGSGGSTARPSEPERPRA